MNQNGTKSIFQNMNSFGSIAELFIRSCLVRISNIYKIDNTMIYHVKVHTDIISFQILYALYMNDTFNLEIFRFKRGQPLVIMFSIVLLKGSIIGINRLAVNVCAVDHKLFYVTSSSV